MRTSALLLFLGLLMASCAPPVKSVRYGSLRAPCPPETVMRLSYCPTRYAYSDRIQHLSKVKVTSLKTGRSVTVSVRMNRRVKGICLPARLKGFIQNAADRDRASG